MHKRLSASQRREPTPRPPVPEFVDAPTHAQLHTGVQSQSVRAAAVTALLGLGIAAIGWVAAASVESAVERDAERTITQRSDTIAAAAASEVAKYLDTLRLVATTLTAVDAIDGEAFDRATRPLQDMDLAGATSLAFIAPPVDTAGVADFESFWRSRGSRGLELSPAQNTRAAHVFSIFSTPLDDSTAKRTGIDVSASTAPHEALMEAWRSGRPALSDAYELIIDQTLPAEQRQTSFSLTAPVRRDGRHLGWVLMGIRGQDFLGHVLDHAAEGKATATLLADDTTGHDTTVASIAGRSAAPSGLGGTGDLGVVAESDAGNARAGRNHQHTQAILAVQHRWTLHVTADTATLVGADRYRWPALTRVGSLLGGVVVAVSMWTAITRRARIRAQIAAATSDLAAAEAATRREASLFTTTLDTIDDIGVSVIDDTGTFLIHSRAARAILGVDPAPESSRSETDRVDRDGAASQAGIGDADAISQWQQHYGMFQLDGTAYPEEQMPLVRALSGETTDNVEMVIRNAARPDGVHIAVSGRPIDLGGRAGALAVFRDVTNERQQRAELTGFAGVVAHDLKHPLTIITAYLDLLIADVIPTLDGQPEAMTTAESHLNRVRTASMRMAELIDSLLAYTTAQDAALDVHLTDLNDLVREAVDDLVPADLQPLGQSQIHVGDLPTIEADPHRLRQVITNLVSNALKYVAPGTTPRIDITAQSYKDRGTLRARLLIADRGIGIPLRDQARVLKPFERAQPATPEGPAYAGTGLGLAICNRIVRRHGGTLTLQPNPGGGTIAVVDLPFVQGPAAPDTTAKNASTPASSRTGAGRMLMDSERR